MSPLQIKALLNLHSRAKPLEHLPLREASSMAMHDAYRMFREAGLLADGVSHSSIFVGCAPYPFLSDKGAALVLRLLEINP